MSRLWGSCIILVIAIWITLTPGIGQADTWFPAAPLTPTRGGATATLLPDGEILFAGGYGGASGSLDVAQLFDPASDTWSAAASMLVGRSYQAAVLLGDGEVLVVGGDEEAVPHERPKTAELYDSASNTWTAISAPPELQGVDSMTRLQSGEVLLVGVFGPQSYGASRGAAIYDPTSNGWRAGAAPQQTAPRQTLEVGASVLLPNGNVMFVGGDTSEDTSSGVVEIQYTVLNGVEEYNPTTNTWSSVAPMHQARAQETATVLDDGDVLITGGVDEITTGSDGRNAVASVELYDPQTNAWSALGPMNLARQGHSATLLPSGDVLVVGGDDCGSETCLGFGGSGDCCGASSAEVYESATNTWTFTTPITTGMWHTATSLPDGDVLVTGGDFAPIPMPSLNTAEIYAPSYPPDEQSVQPRAATTTPTITTTAASPTGSVTLAIRRITTTSGGRSEVKLRCKGTGTCSGELTLTAKSTPKKGKQAKARAETIGTASFSIPPGKTATIELKLDAAGRALLNADHGHLGATLTIIEASPTPSRTQTQSVHLEQKKVAKVKKAIR